MHKIAQAIKPEVQTISSEVENLRKLLNDIEVLSETLGSELLHESTGILPIPTAEDHSLDSLSEQISFMAHKAFRVKGILQDISTRLGSFSKGRSVE
mgnify:CR=1 FL=1